jgi:hypothetical protein
MDNGHNVDKRPANEPGILAAVLEAAEARFGLRGRVLARGKGAAKGKTDARVRLVLGKKAVDFDTETKAGLRPPALGPIVQRLKRARNPTLLIADYVTPPMAETLRNEGVQFLDAAGNAYLNHPPWYIWVKGERPTQRFAAHVPRGRAFAPTGLMVMLAVLCKPELVARPYRALAAAAGVAHGTVGWVMPEMAHLGFVADVGGKRRLVNPAELLRQWTEGYLRTLRPRLLLGRFRTDTLDEWPRFKARAYGFAMGGETAAARLTKLLKPETVTMYGKTADPKFILDQRLRTDPRGNVEVLRRFWAFDPDAEMAPLPVIYADLLQTGDARCFEAAQMIHEKFLAGFGTAR